MFLKACVKKLDKFIQFIDNEVRNLHRSVRV